MSILHTIEQRAVLDWEHAVSGKIERNKQKEGFPKAEGFGVTDAEVSDYIYDKQRILDRGEERRKNFIVSGILLVMPIIVLSAFGNGVSLLLAGVAAGIVLMVAYFIIMRAIDDGMLKKMADERIEKYIRAVMDFEEK